MWDGMRGNNATWSALVQLSVTLSTTHKQIRPFWCWFLGGWVCVHFRTLWVSPTNFPVRLGVSAAASTPTGFFSQRLWGFISLHWNPGLRGLSHSPVVPSGWSTCKYGTTHFTSCHLAWSASLHLAKSPSYPNCPSPPLLPVWMNVSFTLWLFDFHTVWFSGSSDYFLFLNMLLSFCGCTRKQSVYLPMFPSWPEVQNFFFNWNICVRNFGL